MIIVLKDDIKNKYHYKIIVDKLFEIRKLDDIKKSKILDLFIDSANINNKNGFQLTNFGQKK
jgi:hypothetical protein